MLFHNRQDLSRSYVRFFAEFLISSCLDRLSILYLPTCVGSRYELFNLMFSGFSWYQNYKTPTYLYIVVIISQLNSATDFPITNKLAKLILSQYLNSIYPYKAFTHPNMLPHHKLNRYRNINLSSIGTPSRDYLRSRLTLFRWTLKRNP